MEVDQIRQIIERGDALSAQEYRLTRELLDAHERRLNDLSPRVERIEAWVKVDQARWQNRYRPCRKPTYHRANGVCVTKTTSQKVDWKRAVLPD